MTATRSDCVEIGALRGKQRSSRMVDRHKSDSVSDHSDLGEELARVELKDAEWYAKKRHDR